MVRSLDGIKHARFLTPKCAESLKDYFSQFGEVVECTVMRDGPTGRSRGFGFLTFKDPKTVNIVMVKEHYLDGKIVRVLLNPSS
jgi:RNA recognition motif-containing protein